MIALTADTAIVTSIANDLGYEQVFARQIQALGEKGDVAVGITTSGMSANVTAALAMARSQNPDSASCQFYITLGPAAFLDMNYAVFGRVVDGMDAVRQIRAGDRMTSVKLAE